MRPPEDSRTRSIVSALEVAIAASLWGCWSLFLRPSGLPAMVTAPAAYLVIGLLLIQAARRSQPRPRWSRTTLTLLVAYAVVDIINVLAFFAAMELTTIAIAVLTHYLMPFIVALLAPFIERERVRGTLPASVIATLGLVAVLDPGMITSRREIAGALIGLLSAFAYTASVFLARRLIPSIGVMRALSYHTGLGGLILLPLVPFAALMTAPAGAILWILAGILLLGLTGGILFMHGLARIGAARAAVLTYLEPLVAVIVGWIAWKEHLSPWAIAGAVLIVGSGVWISRAPSRPLA